MQLDSGHLATRWTGFECCRALDSTIESVERAPAQAIALRSMAAVESASRRDFIMVAIPFCPTRFSAMGASELISARTMSRTTTWVIRTPARIIYKTIRYWFHLLPLREQRRRNGR